MADFDDYSHRFVATETTGSVSAILRRPARPRALYVCAHGAGAGMTHPFLDDLTAALAARGVATFRYQFPYTEAGRKRPNAAPVLEATVRAAVGAAGAVAPALPIVAGGKSMGGRMTSRAAATEPLPGVRGLVFVGFPLHTPKRIGTERADHLGQVELPMLCVQGTRDALADLDLMRGVCKALGARAMLHVIEGGDHSFAVLKRSGRSRDEVMAEIADAIGAWIDQIGRIA